MINDKRVLAIVPARGGSKGIKLKNIQKINNVSLVAMVGNVLKQIEFIDKSIISTDHELIAEEAKSVGIEVPFYRPQNLSGDFVSDLDVLTHALLEIEKIDNVKYDIILMLQPTSPSRKAYHIIEGVKMLIEQKADSVWSVSETDTKAHPYKQLIVDTSSCEINYYDTNGESIIARQQLFKTYHKNGIVYAITRDCLLNKKSIKGEKCVAYVIKELVSNIDTEFDLALAEFLLSRMTNMSGI